ncbi:EAL domain-containing protein [Gilvimarinus sp. DA14]|uniref:EAL domain-containing protein n=1 Tax=Gilvimarinus sp. DA14 TaxID=2956798 RepID=UPI0020B814C8|nr:EAL domain-containing protein [Gilvimarinus sp. DA14]UTF58584.1 EAL domain-containing protein [Gilvimarinus sp. DA14]
MKDKLVLAGSAPCSASQAQARYFPCFQPIIELETGGVAGNEALARCLDERGNIVSAAALFFDESQPQQWVLEIDRAIRQKALAQFAKQTQPGFLALNISPEWVDRLPNTHVIPTLQMIESLQVDPRRVVIEVTERSGNLENLRRLTREYQRYGIRVAVDDFGSGASQVDRIIALEPDLIKLDMTLFKAATAGGAAADIALATTAMAMRAGCQIVCEGVESPDEFDFAVECGADMVQGWIFAPALSEQAPRDAYCAQVGQLKSRYLQRKSDSHRRAFRHQMAVEQEARNLKDWLNAADHATNIHHTLSSRSLHSLGVLRFYWCNYEGTQTSPNYELAAEGVIAEDNYLGSNWSHRPYFSRLIGIRDLPVEQMVVSDIYRDIRSGDMCKTYALALSDTHILLLDVLVNDQVLFAR